MFEEDMVSVPDKNFQENPSNGIRDSGETYIALHVKCPYLHKLIAAYMCEGNTVSVLVCQIRIVMKIPSMVSTTLVKTCLIICFLFDQKLPLKMT
jgi:hypothetical protein